MLLYDHIDFIRDNFTFYTVCHYMLLRTAGFTTRAFRDPPLSKWDLRSFGTLRNAEWCFLTGASRRTISLFYKGRGVQEKFFLDFSVLGDGTDRLSRNVGNYHSALHKIPQDGRILVPLQFCSIIFKPWFHYVLYTSYSCVFSLMMTKKRVETRWIYCVLNFNPFNAELNPACHLLALLGAHHILHVSRLRFKDNLTLMCRVFS
jgi:hypothetical protein